MNKLLNMIKGITLIIPLYRSIKHAQALGNNLCELRDELTNQNMHIVLIDDSPTEQAHSALITHIADILAPYCSVEVIKNAVNLGFLKSVNKGLKIAFERLNHALILNSDTIVSKGVFAEMLSGFEYDGCVGFVSPRSNNASLCSLPTKPCRFETQASISPKEHALVAKSLSRFTFTPTVIGFCMLVHWNVLDKVGYFDEIYGKGYNEENDLVMRGRKLGFSAILANHAFVHHEGTASFLEEEKELLDQHNKVILCTRYPEFLQTIYQYTQLPEVNAEQIFCEHTLRSNCGETIEIGIDATILDQLPHHDAVKISQFIINSFLYSKNNHFHISVICSLKTAKLYGLDLWEELKIISLKDAYGFDFWIKIPPFSMDNYWNTHDRALKMIYLLPDTIHWNNQSFDTCARFAAEFADAILFTNSLSIEQFFKRYFVSSDTITAYSESEDGIAKTMVDIIEKLKSDTKNIPLRKRLNLKYHLEKMSQDKLNAKEKELLELVNSSSWKATQPLRDLGHQFQIIKKKFFKSNSDTI